jgi:hypothetical protein
MVLSKTIFATWAHATVEGAYGPHSDALANSTPADGNARYSYAACPECLPDVVCPHAAQGVLSVNS